MKSIVVAPDPGLLESMRSIGYTVESAVADVIDNSVAARAKRIHILFSADGPLELAVLDDGAGMTRDEAISAMRLAAKSPGIKRDPHDLGRFGLGLKTASLSQCRVLSVVTKRAGALTALQWNLDHILQSGEWALIELDVTDLDGLLGWHQLETLEEGTLVHWGDLDQLGMTEGTDQSDFDAVAVRVRDHVGLVFHRYITGDEAPRIEFVANDAPIQPIDPFMSHLKLTQKTSWETIQVGGEAVRLMAYTLPYLNRLGAADRARAVRLGTLRETQGFYVYRACRLVMWGNWFGVVPRSELAKLTRVRVDLPNTLDHLWALDVKKSVAKPPPQVVTRLRQLARTMTRPSETVQKFQGRKVSQSNQIDFMWDVTENGDEFGYQISRGHPSIVNFVEGLTPAQRLQFELCLQDIEATFPVVDAHNRLSGDKVPVSTVDVDPLLQRAAKAWTLAEPLGLERDDFIMSIARSEPYCRIDDFAALLRKVVMT